MLRARWTDETMIRERIAGCGVCNYESYGAHTLDVWRAEVAAAAVAAAVAAVAAAAAAAAAAASKQLAGSSGRQAAEKCVAGGGLHCRCNRNESDDARQ